MQDNINLKKIIEKYNIHPRKKFGQNFIFDSNILNKILNNILPVKGYNIIEIGPGPGGLTLEILKKKPKEIILIEIDPSFKDILNHLLAEFNTIKSNLIIDDFLNINFDTFIFDTKNKFNEIKDDNNNTILISRYEDIEFMINNVYDKYLNVSNKKENRIKDFM